jgi:hypothetical protein
MWSISLFLFGGIFNLTFSLMLFYLRSKGGTDKYTKSQLWALSLLAWLFLLNFMISVSDCANMYIYNNEALEKSWGSFSLWMTLTLFTPYLLLSFGLVYPRPFTRWTRLRIILIGILMTALALVAYDMSIGHIHVIKSFTRFDLIEQSYTFAVFIPVFIWLSEYGRQPSNESRTMYTILIWGFLFAIITRSVREMVLSEVGDVLLSAHYIVETLLISMVLIKLALSMWRLRKRWATSETLHISMIVLSIIIGIATGLIHPTESNWNPFETPGYEKLVSNFMGLTFGWLIVRPALFSYGLLRYRLLGSQVRAESNLALIGAILMSTFVSLFIINLTQGQGGPAVVFGAIFLGVLLIYPFLRVSQGIVTRLLPMSAGAKGVSMRERRNTYLMGLQTAVISGEVPDRQDRAALEELRKALRVTEREHILLLESIAKHEARIVPRPAVEEAYLIFRDGRLLGHLIPDVRSLKTDGAPKEKDKDIVAGMFAAISDYVKEAMSRRPDGGRVDTISYGPSSLVIETDRNVHLAVVLKSQDDLAVRQVMRDTLAEVNERYKKYLSKSWDGNRDDLEGLEDLLAKLVLEVGRLEG